MNDDLISLREFARRLKVSDKTIRDAIKLEKIKQGLVTVDGKQKINYSIAQKEAEACNLGAKSRYGKEPEPMPVKEKPKPQTEATEEATAEISITDAMTMANAQRAEKIAKARLAQLEVEEKTGKLVNSDEIYKELYEYGKQVRTNVMSIPDRITDQLISLASDRNAFHNLMTDTLIEALNTLATIEEKVNL